MYSFDLYKPQGRSMRYGRLVELSPVHLALQ